jgi:hypothetical protein
MWPGLCRQWQATKWESGVPGPPPRAAYLPFLRAFDKTDCSRKMFKNLSLPPHVAHQNSVPVLLALTSSLPPRGDPRPWADAEVELTDSATSVQWPS